MIPTDQPIPFNFIQFPVKTSLELTIKKSQGQTFESLGMDEKNVVIMANCMLA